MSPKALLIVLGVVGAGAVVVIQSNNAKPKKLSEARSSEPPPDALYLDVGPTEVLTAGAMKPGPAKDAALDEVVGRWNPLPGWQGAVEQVIDYRGREALRLVEYGAGILGGSYTIIAVVGEGHGTEKGKTVHVQGCVADVTVKPVPGGVANQIVLDPAWIVK